MAYGFRHLVAFCRRNRLADELREEIQHHLELREQQLIAEGMSPADARRAARRAFGSATRFHEESREMWGFPSIDSLLQDVRFGARLLWRFPSSTAISVFSLAVGIGAAAAVFNVADAVLFRPLAVKSPQELREFRATAGYGGATKQFNSVSLDGLRTIANAAEFGEIAGFQTLDDGVLAGAGMGQHAVRIELASDGYFGVLGVSPSAGRLLSRQDAAHAPLAVVLSERLWRGAFAADAAISGRPVTVNGVPAVIVGVARGFRGLMAERPADLFVPAAAAGLIDPAAAAGPRLRVVVRLRPTVSLPVAEQRMTALYREVAGAQLRRAAIRAELMDASRGVSEARELLQQPVLLGLALVSVLLLVASANTGGLLLARFTSRSGEFAVRTALGAGRARLMRQMVMEALLLAIVAGAAGLLVARAGASVLLGAIPLESVPPDFELRLDWRLAAFTCGIATVAGLIAAGTQVFRLGRSSTATVLTQNSRSVVKGRRKLTEALIATQVACSLILLVSAWAMTRTLLNLGRVDPGFRPAGVIAITVDATGRAPDDKALTPYYEQLHERIRSAPQMTRVSSVQFGLMTSAATTGTIEIAGRAPTSDDDRSVRMFWVGPDFFETLGMPFVAGSSIGRREAAGRQRVAVVNQAFADFYFGGAADAIGRTVNRDIRIIGVTADARYGTLRDEPVRAMFIPYTQAPARTRRTFIARTSGDTSAAISSALAAVRAHDPAVKVDVTTLQDQIAATMSRERFVARLAAVLSALALLLCCAGLYGAVAYTVSERRPELAVRFALGATRRHIFALVVSDPLRVTALGLLLGIPGTYAILRALASFLFGVKPFDGGTIVACAAGVMMISVLASLSSARRAAAIQPQECLKGS